MMLFCRTVRVCAHKWDIWGTAESLETAFVHFIVLMRWDPSCRNELRLRHWRRCQTRRRLEREMQKTLGLLPGKFDWSNLLKLNRNNYSLYFTKNMSFICSNNKRGGYVNQNKKPLKKSVSLHPGQEKDPLPKAEIVSYICNIKIHQTSLFLFAAFWICFHDLSKVQNGIKPKKAKSPTGGTCKLRGWVYLAYGIYYINNNTSY